MGNRHRPAIRDLGLEVRHHSFDCAQDKAAAAAENVAKTHRDERTPALLRGILHDPFDELRAGISARRLVMPITLTGLTALSDEMSTKRSAPLLTTRIFSALWDLP